MKISLRRLALALAAALPLVGLAACSDSPDHDAHAHEKGEAYHCPMHPQILQDKPGSCPICGMDLVTFTPDDAPSPDMGHADSGVHRPTGKDVKVDPGVVQKIGVRTEIVDAGVLGREFRADAEGILDAAAEVSVTLRAMGFLETVAAVRPGDRVRAGQVLATLYAPDLVAAQGDWLEAHTRGDSVAARASREQLLSLGFPEASFATVLARGRALRAIPVTSPATGWVRSRSAVRGQSAMAGAELFRIVEGAGALLEANLPAGDAAAVKVGDIVELRGDGLPATFSARVASVSPELDRATRSSRVRLVPSSGATVRPGALYRATFRAATETGFVIPSDAVLHSGSRDVVFLALGDGRFRPVEVVLGPSSGGRTLVRSGLEAGDEVVLSAQFLLDGESRLQAAFDQLGASEATASGHGSHP